MSGKLPDLLQPGLGVVFCGTAAGNLSAERGEYYANPGNRFWSTLWEVGLTDRRLGPHEYRRLLEYGIGLTDLAKHASGKDAHLPSTDFDVAGFKERLLAARPRFIAFNGKKSAAVLLGTPKVHSGRQEQRLGTSVLWVLPSTSGLASGHWSIEPWRALAKAVRAANGP